MHTKEGERVKLLHTAIEILLWESMRKKILPTLSEYRRLLDETLVARNMRPGS